MPHKIFISYRREDAKAEARSIFQHLQRVFGRDNIFMDVDSIQKGLDFTKVLETSLAETAVMLVVMGRSWLDQVDEAGRRRIDDPHDYVRLEVATALDRDIAVIPVRVDGGRVPPAEELPDDLKSLVRRQGTIITHENFDSDVRGLEDDIRRLILPRKRARGLTTAIAAGLALLAAGAGAWLWQLQKPVATVAQAPAPAPAKKASTDATAVAVRAAAAWSEAQRANTFAAYRDYIRSYPKSQRVKEAADAAIPLLRAEVERRLDAAVANAKRRDGTLNGYIGSPEPRAMAMCIEWAGTSYDSLVVHTWGSSQVRNTPMEQLESTALAFCSNNAPSAQRCTCEIVHRNGKAVLKFPTEWTARQLR